MMAILKSLTMSNRQPTVSPAIWPNLYDGNSEISYDVKPAANSYPGSGLLEAANSVGSTGAPVQFCFQASSWS